MQTPSGSGAELASLIAAAGAAYQANDWRRTLALCNVVLARAPEQGDALLLAGVVEAQGGAPARALPLLERAAAARPGHAPTLNALGNVLRELGRLADALARYELALAAEPRYPEALGNRGSVLRALGRHAEALASYDAALALHAADPATHYNRGVVLQDLGRHADATEAYRRATLLAPGFAEAYYNLGGALQALRRFEGAEDSYRRVVALKPAFAPAHNNRGNALEQLGRTAEAAESYRRALALDPALADAHYNLGHALQALGRPEQALESFARARALKPGLDWVHGAHLYAKQLLADWDGLAEATLDAAARVRRGERAAVPFTLLAATDDPALLARAAAIAADSAALVAEPLAAPPRARRAGRLRIGYFSADFHEHATAFLLGEVLELHDRSKFEIVAFSFGPAATGPTRRRLAGAVDAFHDVRGCSDREIALRARELGIDVAVDLKGLTRDARPGIFAHRAAPVQAAYLGYPGTMGVDYIDYLLADRVVVPDSLRAHYPERVVYLPGSYQANDRRRPRPAAGPTRREVGLPEAGFVFACFNSPYKITPGVFASWLRILGRVAGSVLWCYADNATVIANLRRAAEAGGIGGERLVFAPPQPLAQHLARYRRVDLFLDTFPCGAHTTASDALWMGVPVLTRVGASFAARVAASLLGAVDLAALAVVDEVSYEAAAVGLASDPARLAAVRERLESGRPTAPLFDAPRLTRALESAYAAMHARVCAGEAPADLDLDG